MGAPLPEEAVTDALYEALQELADAVDGQPLPSPQQADRIEAAIDAAHAALAMRAATQPTAMPEEALERLRDDWVEVLRGGPISGVTITADIAAQMADDIQAALTALSTPIPLKPKVDEDAEWIRSLTKWGNLKITNERTARLERIAARLEYGK